MCRCAAGRVRRAVGVILKRDVRGVLALLALAGMLVGYRCRTLEQRVPRPDAVSGVGCCRRWRVARLEVGVTDGR